MGNLTREQWLQHAVTMLRDEFRSIDIPEVQVSCSWPGGGSARTRIGECWARAASKADVNEVFISPKLEEPGKVLGILAHELAHAVDDCKNGHRAGFTKIAKAMGCEGKPTQMVPPESVTSAWAERMVAGYGAYPHKMLDKSLSGVKKQTCRQIKCVCGDCGAIWRMSQTVIDTAAAGLSCPVCQGGDVSVG